MLIFLDLETTGLDPEKEQILELGIIVCDRKLNEVESGRWVLPLDRPRSDLSPFILRMHGPLGSGLLDEIEANAQAGSDVFVSPCPIASVQRRALELVSRYAAPKECKLAGNSVHFDKSFLKEYMPLLHDFFHHRNLDVSAAGEWWQVKTAQPFRAGDKVPAHDALSDIRSSIEEARKVLGWTP